MKHVVAALKLARGFDPDDIGRFLHHTDHLGVAIGIAAELAQIAIADVVADAAEAEFILDVEDGLRQVAGIVARASQDVEREALRRLLADSGQAFEFVDEASEGFGEIGHG